MSKIILFIILGGLALAATAVVNINGVNAHEETNFIQISVLSKNQANYGVDENSSPIPAVSIEILEDKLHDVRQKSSIPIIRYTSLPVESQGSGHQDDDNAQSPDQDVPHNNPGNGASNQNVGNNGNGNSNQNAGNNGNGNSNAGSGNNNSNKDKGTETKPDKSNVPENKGTATDKPGKTK